MEMVVLVCKNLLTILIMLSIKLLNEIEKVIVKAKIKIINKKGNLHRIKIKRVNRNSINNQNKKKTNIKTLILEKQEHRYQDNILSLNNKQRI
jgi:hypothetical protein